MSDSESGLLQRLHSGDRAALAALFSLHRQRLWKLAKFRLHPRLASRVDADDVLQDAFLAAATRLDHFLAKAGQSFFVWLRLIVLQTITDLHRKHLQSKGRNVQREVAMVPYTSAVSTSVSLAGQLAGSFTSPSGVVMRAEMAAQLETALDAMHEIDREVLAMRHFEELDNAETAEVLGIDPKAASIRYVRAIKRLKEILAATTGAGREDR